MPVFQSGSTHFTGSDAEPLCDLAGKILGPHVTLLNPEVEIITAAARLVGGDLFDLKIFGCRLDTAADAGQVGSPEGRRCQGVKEHFLAAVGAGGELRRLEPIPKRGPAPVLG